REWIETFFAGQVKMCLQHLIPLGMATPVDLEAHIRQWLSWHSVTDLRTQKVSTSIRSPTVDLRTVATAKSLPWIGDPGGDSGFHSRIVSQPVDLSMHQKTNCVATSVLALVPCLLTVCGCNPVSDRITPPRYSASTIC